MLKQNDLLTLMEYTILQLCLVAWPLNESEAGGDLDSFDRNVTAFLTQILTN